MKTTVKVVAVLFFISSLATTVMAQKQGKGKKGEQRTPENRTSMWMQKIGSQLNLTPEQTAKVNEVVLAREKARDVVKEKSKGDKEAVKKEMQASHKQFNASLNGILTKEQQQKLKEIRKTMKAEKEKRKAENKEAKKGNKKEGKKEGKKETSSSAADEDELEDSAE